MKEGKSRLKGVLHLPRGRAGRKNPGPFSHPLLRAFALAVIISASGCKAKPRIAGVLPMPPAADSGVYDGQFVQVDYGFGFPLPPKWLYVKLTAEQEVDEVARFSNADHTMILRLTVQLQDPSRSLSAKSWEDGAQQDLKDHLFKILKSGDVQEWKTQDSGPWLSAPFRIQDPRGGEWVDQEWALKREDLLIGAHAMVPQDEADTEAGQKFLKAVEGALTQIRWYTPIGPRGISIERFELQHFTDGFCRALESRSTTKVGAYFDDMYPDRTKWNTWYQQVVSGDPQSFGLKAELSGLVINGDYATASFTLARKDKAGSKPEKFEKNFRLSKKEGSWKITASLDKSEK